MMKIEAESLLGREMDDKEFDLLNYVYLESRYDKESVCKAWGSLEDTRVLVDLADRIVDFRNEFSKLSVSHKEVTSKLRQMEVVACQVERFRVKFSDCNVTFDRGTMKYLYHNREQKRTIAGKLYYTSDFDNRHLLITSRLKYDSLEPMPKEVKQTLEMLGFEIVGPL